MMGGERAPVAGRLATKQNFLALVAFKNNDTTGRLATRSEFPFLGSEASFCEHGRLANESLGAPSLQGLLVRASSEALSKH